MQKEDLVASVFFLLFSSVIVLQSYRLNIGTLSRPEAGFLPFVAGIVLGIFSFVLLIVSITKKMAAVKQEKPLTFNKGGFYKVAYVTASLLAYAVLLIPLGFLLDTLLFMGFLLIVVERNRWHVVIIGAISAAVVFYLIFDVLLKLQLPRGFVTL